MAAVATVGEMEAGEMAVEIRGFGVEIVFSDCWYKKQCAESCVQIGFWCYHQTGSFSCDGLHARSFLKF